MSLSLSFVWLCLLWPQLQDLQENLHRLLTTRAIDFILKTSKGAHLAAGFLQTMAANYRTCTMANPPRKAAPTLNLDTILKHPPADMEVASPVRVRVLRNKKLMPESWDGRSNTLDSSKLYGLN